MVRSFLSLTAVLLLSCSPALAEPETAPADPTQPETAKDDHKLQPENGKTDHKMVPEDATDTRKPSKRERDAEQAKRGVRSNTPPPPPAHKPPG